MRKNGILPGRTKGKATPRVRSIEQYSVEFTSVQIRASADIAENYGSGQAHVAARQTFEIPDIGTSNFPTIITLVTSAGIVAVSSGNYTRNVMACFRWCLCNVLPVSNLVQKLNKLHADRQLPGKTIISLAKRCLEYDTANGKNWNEPLTLLNVSILMKLKPQYSEFDSFFTVSAIL